VQLENKEWKVYMAARDNLEHQVARAGWIADYVEPTNFFDIFRSYSGNNRTAWGTEKYDQLMKEIEKTGPVGERNKLFEQANKILFDEMPVIPIYYYSDVNLVSPAVRNWHDNVMHFHPLKKVYLDPSALVEMK
jgi:oligopeptide transport system substrate-binding protein